MEIFDHRGICLKKDKRAVYLDPSSGRPDGAVTHAHSDHLRPRTHMTPPTADVMKVRTGSKKATLHDYNDKFKINDFELEFISAGHVIGSAMIECEDVLYTGDYNPYGTITAGIAKPQDCDTLIVESTYGKPEQVLPDRNEVLTDLQAWIKATSANNGAIIRAYSFGKAQEVIATANFGGITPVVSDVVSSVSDIYRKNGVKLEYNTYSELTEKETKAETQLLLNHGDPLVFGVDDSKGLMLEGATFKVVNMDDGYDLNDILKHNMYDKNLAMLLSEITYIPELPVPIGILYKEDKPT